MRIFFTTGSLYPAQIGGPDNIIYWWAKSLVRQGHQAILATTDDGIEGKAPLDRWLDTEYGRVLYVKTLFHYVPIRLILRSLRPLWQSDVLHAGAIFYPASWILATTAIIMGKKVVWTSHGELDPEALVYSASRKKPILWSIKNFLARKVLFHSTCDAETSYLRQQFGPDTAIVQLPYQMELPARLDLPTQPYLLFLGRLHPKKAVENLIAAAARSSAFLASKFTLRVAGSGEASYMESLKLLVREHGLEDKIILVGHIAGDAKQQMLAEAYFSFMPSHTENFGIVVTEALAHGTPVTASKTTPWAILEEKGCGFWVDNSVEELRQVIDQVLELDPDTYQKMRARSVETARLFDIRRQGGDWVKIYEDLLANRR